MSDIGSQLSELFEGDENGYAKKITAKHFIKIFKEHFPNMTKEQFLIQMNDCGYMDLQYHLSYENLRNVKWVNFILLNVMVREVNINSIIDTIIEG